MASEGSEGSGEVAVDVAVLLVPLQVLPAGGGARDIKIQLNSKNEIKNKWKKNSKQKIIFKQNESKILDNCANQLRLYGIGWNEVNKDA